MINHDYPTSRFQNCLPTARHPSKNGYIRRFNIERYLRNFLCSNDLNNWKILLNIGVYQCYNLKLYIFKVIHAFDWSIARN